MRQESNYSSMSPSLEPLPEMTQHYFQSQRQQLPHLPQSIVQLSMLQQQLLSQQKELLYHQPLLRPPQQQQQVFQKQLQVPMQIQQELALQASEGQLQMNIQQLQLEVMKHSQALQESFMQQLEQRRQEQKCPEQQDAKSNLVHVHNQPPLQNFFMQVQDAGLRAVQWMPGPGWETADEGYTD